MDGNEQRYTIKDLAAKYYETERTIRNYIERMADVFSFNKDSLKLMNEKGTLEYALTVEQEQLIGLLIQGKDKDPFLKKEKDTEKIREVDVREYRDKLIDRIEQLQDEGVRNNIKTSETYRLGKRLKAIYMEKDTIQDAFLFLIEHIPLKERVNMEEQLLAVDKRIVKYLMDRFIKKIGEQAYDSLRFEEDEDGGFPFDEPSEEQLKEKVKELLDEQFKKRALIDHQFAGYSTIEKAIGELLKDTIMKEKDGD